mmetsp:Transcript_135889/g.330337  ORF Transcript_135889/g.330337 Transcript_135889/m.330337 type:complete len:211 (+) Transcript_135889:252-884(+)
MAMPKSVGCSLAENARVTTLTMFSLPFSSSRKMPLRSVAVTIPIGWPSSVVSVMAIPVLTADWSPPCMTAVVLVPSGAFHVSVPSLLAVKSHSPRAKLCDTSMPRQMPRMGTEQVALQWPWSLQSAAAPPPWQMYGPGFEVSIWQYELGQSLSDVQYSMWQASHWNVWLLQRYMPFGSLQPSSHFSFEIPDWPCGSCLHVGLDGSEKSQP